MDYKFRITPLPISENSAFAEASAEELRVLIAIKDKGGEFAGEDIMALAGVSRARLASAIALWQGAGVLLSAEAGESFLAYEFEERPSLEDFAEEGSAALAATIRDEGLSGLINEFAVLLEKDTLSPMEIKWLVSLKGQFAVPEEYILLLASRLKEKGTLTVHRLCLRATSLCKRGVDTVEELEASFKAEDENKTVNSQIKSAFGIRRNLNKSEREFARRWSEELGYSIAIITEAFDRMPTGSSLSFEYIDKILSDWHSAGCKTVEDCAKRHEEWRREKAAAGAASGAASRDHARKPQSKPTMKYGDFDPEEALRRALERSIADTDGSGNN